MHVVAILAALYDDEVGCILIDEPEVSLHPQLQAFLYAEMLNLAGNPEDPTRKLVFLSTHSPEFIQVRAIEDIASLLFCESAYEAPIQVDPLAPEFGDRKVKSLLARLGHEHKLALFCKRPLLVEGISDQIVCMGLARMLGLYFEAAGSQVVPVGGKGQMVTLIKLMGRVGKEPVVLADTDAFADGLDVVGAFSSKPEFLRLVTSSGHKDGPTFARSVHSDFCEIVRTKWGDIEALAIQHSYWTGRIEGEDEKARRRSALATLLCLDEVEVRKLKNAPDWVAIKSRLDSLLLMLQSVGCFILRKGTIENYYMREVKVSGSDKPNAALEETFHFEQSTEMQVTSAYEDVVNAMAYAAQTEQINEGSAIRNLVLAIAAPALANCGSCTEDELNSSSKDLVGKKANLFKSMTKTGNGKTLRIELLSKILKVYGFPLSIQTKENLIESVERQMKLGGADRRSREAADEREKERYQ